MTHDPPGLPIGQKDVPGAGTTAWDPPSPRWHSIRRWKSRRLRWEAQVWRRGAAKAPSKVAILGDAALGKQISSESKKEDVGGAGGDPGV